MLLSRGHRKQTHNHTLPQPYFIVFPVDQCQLEFELGRIDGEDTWTTFPVQTIDVVSLHPGHVDRQVQSANDAVISRMEMPNV